MQNRETIVRIVLVALMIYALFSFASARRELVQTRQTVLRLEEEYESLTEENRQLEQRLASGSDDETMEALAWERLGLVMPGETVFYFTTDRED